MRRRRTGSFSFALIVAACSLGFWPTEQALATPPCITAVAREYMGYFRADLKPERIVALHLNRPLQPDRVVAVAAAAGVRVRVLGARRKEVVVELLDGDPKVLAKLPITDDAIAARPDKWPAPNLGTEHEAKVWAAMPPLERPVPTRAEVLQAAKTGVTIVVDESSPPSPVTRKNRELLYGAKIFYAGDLPPGEAVVNLPGLVLQLGDSPNVFRVRGEANPLLGLGPKRRVLDKVAEMQWLTSVAPEFVPRSRSASEFKGVDGGSIVPVLDDFLSGKIRHIPKETRDALAIELSEFLKRAKKGMKDADIILKYAHSRQTGGSYNLVMTPEEDGGSMTGAFCHALAQARRNNRGLSSLRDEATAAAIADTDYYHFAQVIRALLTDRSQVLVQEKLSVMHFATGGNEFRVDVVGGHIVGVSGFEYVENRVAQTAATETVNRFLRTLGDETARAFSGGIDVVQLEDGTFKIVETNAGVESGSLYAYIWPIEANLALSELTQRPTPFVAALRKATYGTHQDRVAFLRQFQNRTRDEYNTLAQIPRRDLFFRMVSDLVAEGKITIQEVKKLQKDAGLESDTVATLIVTSLEP